MFLEWVFIPLKNNTDNPVYYCNEFTCSSLAVWDFANTCRRFTQIQVETFILCKIGQHIRQYKDYLLFPLTNEAIDYKRHLFFLERFRNIIIVQVFHIQKNAYGYS
jgi:hypothetical protein